MEPCLGSQFQLDGTYILGPSPRNMDQYELGAFHFSWKGFRKKGMDGGATPIHPFFSGLLNSFETHPYEFKVENGELLVNMDRKILGEEHP